MREVEGAAFTVIAAPSTSLRMLWLPFEDSFVGLCVLMASPAQFWGQPLSEPAQQVLSN